MAARVDSISIINDNKETWKFVGLVVHVWNYIKNGTEDCMNTIEVLFMDAKGDRIRGTVKKFLLHKFKDVLVEGKTYLVQHFHVEQNNGDYKCTQHPFRIVFNRSSVIQPRETSIPFHGFDFIDFEDIISHKAPKECLVDVIGEISYVSELTEYTNNGVTSKRIEVVLIDIKGSQLKCILWGSYADLVSQYIKDNDNKKHSLNVMVFQLCRIKTFGASLTVTNSLQASKIIFNPDIPECEKLKKVINLSDDSMSQRYTQTSTYSSYNLRDDFLYLTPRKIVIEIASSTEVGKFIALGTVKMMQTEQPWFFDACISCKKKFQNSDGKVNCYNCGQPPSMIIPRFRIQMLVNDLKTKLSFVVFEPDATTICKVTASEIRDRLMKDNDSFDYPFEIKEAFLEKTFLFKVDIAQNNINKVWQSYTIVKMTNDESLISEFIQLYGGHQVEEKSAKSNDCEGRDMVETLAPNVNETISVCSENEVEVGNEVVITPYKRNPQELDLDDCPLSALISPQNSTAKFKLNVSVKN